MSSAQGLVLYRASGRLRGMGVLRFAVQGASLALGLGLLYGALGAASWPLVALVFIALLAGALLGAVLAQLLKTAHSRSVRLNAIAAAAFALTLLWARWVGELAALGGWSGAWGVTVSGELVRSVVALAQHHARSGGAHAEPLLYLLAWSLEALGFTAMCVLVARGMAREPYSEAAQAWSKDAYEGELYAGTDPGADLTERLARDGVRALLALPRAAGLAATSVASQWWTVRVKARAVMEDPAARWLDLSVVDNRRRGSGRVGSRDRALVQAWQLSAADFEALRDHLAASVDTPVDAPVHALVHAGCEPARNPAPSPGELKAAVAALEAGNHVQAHALASVHRTHASIQVRADALRVCALALARMQRWAPAFAEFDRLFEIEPEARNALQLAQTAVQAGDPRSGQDWFERAEALNHKQAQLKPPELRTAMISALEQAGQTGACMPHLEWLAAAYRSLPTTDSHIVCMHGLPFFSAFLARSRPIVSAALGVEAARAWYAALRPGLDEDGQRQIDVCLTALNLS